MSLLDILESCRRQRDYSRLCEAIPYARFLGISVQETAGRLQTRLTYRPANVGNPTIPALHGGAVGAFLETAAIMELLITRESKELPKVINITVDYLRPAAPVDTYAVALITRQGRRIANVFVEGWQTQRNRLVATANCHFLIRDDP